MSTTLLPLSSAFRGRRVLVTGHTGFKGSWLAWWLHLMGARVAGLALPPKYRMGPFARARMSDVIFHEVEDIRDLNAVRRCVKRVRPDFVFHLAAQPLVRESYQTPVETFDTNIMGTANLLEAIRRSGHPCCAVIVTSDKCYENREWVYSYRENDAMGGHDPYSASKGCAELVAASYARSFFGDGSKVLVATARAGNVMGPGDWSRDRIVPDSIVALQADRALIVRNPHAIRPWQHVLEPLAGYLRLAERLRRGGRAFAEAWNFGPAPESTRSVADLADAVVAAWGSGRWTTQAKRRAAHEANTLRLSIEKSVTRLGWQPAWSFERAVAATVNGYKELCSARGAAGTRAFMESEIRRYAADARAAGAPWASVAQQK